MTALPDEFTTLVSLVNSLDVEANKEGLADAPSCRAWFQAHGFRPDDSFGEKDVVAVHRIREGVRALWRTHNAPQPAPEDAFDSLNGLLSNFPFHWFVANNGELVSEQEEGMGGYLDQLVALLVDASHRPNWHRLKVCQNFRCEWAFYDHSRNQSHRWCTMTVCGSREKARRYRARQRNRDLRQP